jgi:hypothetical protein
MSRLRAETALPKAKPNRRLKRQVTQITALRKDDNGVWEAKRRKAAPLPTRASIFRVHVNPIAALGLVVSLKENGSAQRFSAPNHRVQCLPFTLRMLVVPPSSSAASLKVDWLPLGLQLFDPFVVGIHQRF